MARVFALLMITACTPRSAPPDTHTDRSEDEAPTPTAPTSDSGSGPTEIAGYDAVILASSPVAYWRMSSLGASGEVDLTGHGHDGSYGPTGAHPQQAQLPNGEGAAAFNGTSDYLQVPDADTLSIVTTGELTLEAWIRPDTREFPKQESTHYVHWLGKGESNEQEYVARVYSLTTTDTPPRPNRLSASITWSPQTAPRRFA